MNNNGEDKNTYMQLLLKGILFCFFTLSVLFAQAQVEICDNGIDDDGDGLVDAFDPNCPCDDVVLICEPSCEFSVPGDALSFSVQWVSEDDVPTYQSPLIGDINNDGIPDVVIMSTDDIQTNEPRRARNLRVLNGLTGQNQLTINTPFMGWVGPTPIAIADIDGDGFAEIFVASVDHISNPIGDRRYLYCYNHDGTLRWKSNEQYGYNPNARFGSSIGLADFNRDGIPEIYIYNQIFNAQTGVKLVEGGNESGLAIMTTESWGAIANPVAADLTLHPGLELACGNTVYEVTITNTNGIIGNSMNAITVESKDDGFTSIADIDLDGELDVIVATRGINADIYVWNPRTNSVIASRTLPNTGGNWTGMPFVGDMDKDCAPEIGVTRSRRVYALKYNGTETLQLKWELVTTDVSGFTGITMFDFNQDGSSELVYRDETALRIIDGSGSSAFNIATFECLSGTGAEMPIVADVDGDAQAEICVTCGDNSINIGKLNLFGPLNQAWAPSRRIWNQYAYHNVNINNNLTVPVQQQPHQTLFSNVQCPFFDCSENRPFNNFLQQSTTYTQDGCPVYLATDLQVTLNNNQACDGSMNYELDVVVTNVGEVNADSGVVISFYIGNPAQPGATLINSTPSPVKLTQLLAPGASAVIPVSLDITDLPKPFNLFIVLNDNGSQPSPITFPITGYPECDFTNNIVSITNIDCCPFGDLAITSTEPEDPSLCAGSNLDLTLITSSAAGISENDIIWTLPGGGNVNGGSINVNQAGTYNVSVTDRALCSVDTTIIIQVFPLPTVANAGNDVTICAENFNLQGNSPSVGTGQWAQIEGTGNIINPSAPNSNVTNLSVGVNRFVWSITSGISCISRDTVIITRIPAPDIASVGTNQEVCGTAVNITANSPNIGSGVWSLISGQGNFASASSNNTEVTNLAGGNNVFQWTISNGICPPSIAQITVIRYLDPSNSIAGENQEICATISALTGNVPTIGSGEWALISGSGTIANPNNPTSAVSGLSVGNNVFEWEISNGTCPPTSSQIIITVNDPTITAEAGDDQQICESSTQLAATAVTSGTGSWTLVSGSGTITDVNSPTSTITNLGFGNNIFRWTLVNGACTSFDEVTIRRDQIPSLANAGANQQICATAAILSATNPAIGTGSWVLISGSGDIQNPNSTQTLVSNLLTGQNIFEWTVSSGVCPASSAQVIIQVDQLPINANAGIDQQICENTATFAADAPSVGTGLWTLIAGSGTITNPSSPTSGLTNLGFGNNTFRWTITNGTCTSFDEVNILRDSFPSVAVAGDDQQICGTAAQLNGNAPTTGIGQWTLISGSGDINSAGNPNTIVNNMFPGQNIFQWSVSNGTCPPSTDQVTITVDENPITADAGNNFSVCADNANLSGNVPSPGIGTWTIISGSGNITDINSPNSTVIALGIGNNVFRWTIVNGTCQTFDEITITRDDIPSVSIAGDDQQICANTILLNANSPIVGQGLWTLVSGSGTIVNPESATTSITDLEPGINIFSWTISSGVCPASISQVTISVDENPLSADAGENDNTCDDIYVLQGNNPNTGVGTWELVSGNGIFNDSNDPNATVSKLGLGVNVFSWTIVNGLCVSTSQVTITRNQGPSSAVAGEDQQICANTTLLQADEPIIGNGIWTLVQGQGTITDALSNNTSITNLGTGENIFAWTITEGDCPPSVSELTITVDDNNINANAGIDQTICQPQTQLQAQTPIIGTGVWSIISGSGTIEDPANPQSQLTELSIGTVTLQWTVTNGACVDSAIVNIVFSAFPDEANAGTDQQICSDQTILDANNPEIGTGVWSLITGSAIFENAGQNNTSVSGLQVGVNVLQWTVNNGACPPSNDQVIIIRDEISLEADAGPDFSVCGEETNLAAVDPILGTGVWSVISGGATVNDINNNNSSVSGLTPGANVFQWSVSTGACPPVNDIVTIIRDLPPSDADAGLNQVFCGANGALNAEAPAAGQGLWTLISGSGTIADNQANVSLVNGLQIGTNTFVWTVTNGACPASTDTVTLTREQSVTIANAGPDQQICAEQTNLAANIPQSGSGSWTIISGNAVFSDVNNPFSTVSGLNEGVNIFQWTISSTGVCPPSEDQVAVTKFLPPSEAVVGENLITCQESINLNAQAPTVGIGTWSLFSGNSVITDVSDPNTAVTNLDIGNNTFEWRVTNGVCPQSGAMITIERIENITLNVINLVEVCDTSATLTGDLPEGASGVWTIDSGTGTFEDAAEPLTNVNGLSVGENIFTWTVTYQDCDPVSAQVTVIRYESPETSSAGTNIETCGTSVQLQAETPTIGQGTWSVISGNASFSDINDPQSLITNLDIGLNQLVWTITNGVCTSAADTINVQVDENPLTADAGDDQTICIDNTSLQATPPVSGTGVWSLLTGEGDISDENVLNPVISNLGFGVNIFIFTITDNDCVAFDQVIINRLAPPTAFAGNDTIICGNNLTLNANLPDGATGTWSFVSGSGNISDINDANAIVTDLEEGVNVLSWTLELGDCPSSSASFTINVSCNTPPVTVNDFYETDEDVAVSGNFMENNFDPDGTELTADTIPASGPSNGIIVINPDGTFTYTPNSLFNGQDTVVISVCDNGIPLPAECSNDTLFFTVNPVNNPPVTVNDTVNTTINTPVSGNMNTNNFDPDGTELTLDTNLVHNPRNGNIAVSPNGDFIYVPNSGFIGLDTVVVLVCDSGVPLPPQCNFDTLFIFVSDTTNEDTPPITENDYYVTEEDVAVGGNIMANNSNPSGNPMVLDTIPVSGPSNGTFTITPDGTFTYTPNENWFGNDTIVLIVCDSLSEIPLCAFDTVFITVTAVNDPPVAVNDYVDTPYEQPVSGNMNDNNFDIEGTTLTVDSVLVGPSNGTFVIDSAGNYTYTPNAGFAGMDTVVVLVCDSGFPLPRACANDTLFINVAMPDIEVDAGPDQSICANMTILTANDVLPPDSAFWSLVSGSGNIFDSTAHVTPVTDLGLGENVFVWSVTSQGFTVTDTVIITVNTPASIANAGEDFTACTDSVNLNANIPTVGEGQWSVLTGDGTVLNPSQNNSPVVDLTEGLNQFVWTITNGPCASVDTVDIMYLNVIAPEVPADTQICVGLTYFLPFPSSEFDLTWTSNNNSVVFGEPGVDGVEVSNLPSGATINFTLTATEDGCSASENFDLVILPINFSDCDTTQAIFIPEGFSPNQDGVHDKFVIYNFPDGARMRLQIYNRWGVKVYESNDYKNDWDGTANANTNLVIAGEQLPEGTYYYILQFDFEFNPRVGYLTLWR